MLGILNCVLFKEQENALRIDKKGVLKMIVWQVYDCKKRNNPLHETQSLRNSLWYSG